MPVKQKARHVALPAWVLHRRLYASRNLSPPGWASYLPKPFCIGSPIHGIADGRAGFDGRDAGAADQTLAGAAASPPACGPCAAAGAADDAAPGAVLGAVAGAASGAAALATARGAAARASAGTAAGAEAEAAVAAAAWWRGQVWALARDPQGCRALQDELGRSSLPAAARADLVAELRGRVAEGVRCPQANFVLQKCVTMCSAEEVQFIVDEIAAKGPGAISQVARHKYGCRIVQRLLEAIPSERLRKLTQGLLTHARDCSLDMYGNYVMQHLVEHGTPQQRARMAAILRGCIGKLEGVESRPLWAVISKALTFCGTDDKVELAHRIQCDKGTLKELNSLRLGRIIARRVAEILDGQDSRGCRAIGLSAIIGGG